MREHDGVDTQMESSNGAKLDENVGLVQVGDDADLGDTNETTLMNYERVGIGR